jgi:hypothetical protein
VGILQSLGGLEIGTENLTELLAGRLDYFFCPVNICLPLINDGRVVALAMGSSKRSGGAAERADHGRIGCA